VLYFKSSGRMLELEGCRLELEKVCEVRVERPGIGE